MHPNTDVEAITTVIRFMYGEHILDNLSIDQYTRVLVAADHLGVSACIKAVAEVLAFAVDALVIEKEEVCSLSYCAAIHSLLAQVAMKLLSLPESIHKSLHLAVDRALKPYIARFGQLDNFLTPEFDPTTFPRKDLLAMPGGDAAFEAFATAVAFLKLPIDVAGALLRSCDLRVSSEHVVFHAVSRWYSSNPQQQINPSLWKAVRYPNLGPNFVFDFVQRHPAFNRKEEDEQKIGVLRRKQTMDKLLGMLLLSLARLTLTHAHRSGARVCDGSRQPPWPLAGRM